MRRFKQWVKEAAINPWLPIRVALAIGPIAMYLPHAEKWLVPYLIAGMIILLTLLFMIIILGCFFQGPTKR